MDYWVIKMTMENYVKILDDTNEDGYVSISKANKIYFNQNPNAEYTLFRRENSRVDIGFTSVIIPSCYVAEYFESIPSRKEGIIYKNVGFFEEIMDEFRNFVQSKR